MSEHTWRELERADMDTAAAHAFDEERRAAMTGNRTTLLPCPFCGGKAEIHPSNDWDVTFTGSTFFAWCDKCETRGDYYNTEAEAIAAWNTRVERTCKMEQMSECQFDDIACSECGVALWAFSMDMEGEGVLATPNYCPNCGARVTKSDQYL